MKSATHIRGSLFVMIGFVLAVMAAQPGPGTTGKNAGPQPESSAGTASSRQLKVTAPDSGITVRVRPANVPVTSMVTQQFQATVKGTENTRRALVC